MSIRTMRHICHLIAAALVGIATGLMPVPVAAAGNVSITGNSVVYEAPAEATVAVTVMVALAPFARAPTFQTVSPEPGS